MHSNQVCLTDRFTKILSHGAENKCVADAVKAIFAQAVGSGDLLVYGICFYIVRECSVESRVKVGDACHSWKLSLAQSYDFQG